MAYGSNTEEVSSLLYVFLSFSARMLHLYRTLADIFDLRGGSLPEFEVTIGVLVRGFP